MPADRPFGLCRSCWADGRADDVTVVDECRARPICLAPGCSLVVRRPPYRLLRNTGRQSSQKAEKGTRSRLYGQNSPSADLRYCAACAGKDEGRSGSMMGPSIRPRARRGGAECGDADSVGGLLGQIRRPEFFDPVLRSIAADRDVMAICRGNEGFVLLLMHLGRLPRNQGQVVDEHCVGAR